MIERELDGVGDWRLLASFYRTFCFGPATFGSSPPAHIFFVPAGNSIHLKSLVSVLFVTISYTLIQNRNLTCFTFSIAEFYYLFLVLLLRNDKIISPPIILEIIQKLSIILC